MQVHNSVLKRERQNEKRRLRNKIVKSRVHTAFRRLEDALDKKEDGLIKGCLSNYYKLVDKAVKKNIFHKNNGARKKSKAAKKVKKFFVEHK